MRWITRAAILAGVFLAAGCARQISMTPLESMYAPEPTRIDKTVAYYISSSDLVKEVETPAGGGDRVKYRPYQQAEPALRYALSNVFTNVISLRSLDDKASIASNKVAYIFVPTIETNSSSDSSFTWPPTRFTVKLNCRAVDGAGATVWQQEVTGQGQASFNEFKTDHSRSARLATREAFMLLQREIRDAKQFR